MAAKPYEQLVIARDFAVRRTELTCPAHSLKIMSKAAASDSVSRSDAGAPRRRGRRQARVHRRGA
jgi:hypothetical protein